VHDGVAEVLAQRARLERGPALGIAVSVLLHVGLAAGAFYAATHASEPKAAGVMNIEFGSMKPMAPTPKPVAATPKPEPKVEAPKVEAPKIEQPKIVEPKPIAPEPPKKVEKGTVPLDPFGRSTKKGSETPAVETPKPAAPATSTAPAVPGTTTDVPIGGSGITGLEGGDFPYTLYIQGMHRRIGSNWFRPQVAAGTTSIIYFRIQRDGKITDAKVETSSGNGTFDRAALSAIRSSSPLNPLPYAYNGTYLGVHLTFK
jgi:TonB family protein